MSLAQQMSVVPTAEKLTQRLERLRKALGPLRDLQVETAYLKQKSHDSNNPLVQYAKKKKSKIQKRTKKHLSHLDFKKHKLLFEAAKKAIDQNSSDHQLVNLDHRIRMSLRSKLGRFKKAFEHLPIDDPKRIHELRLKGKQLRYQCEIVNSISDIKIPELKGLTELQKVVGDFQNTRVLKKFIGKFTHTSTSKKKSLQSDSDVQKLKQQIYRDGARSKDALKSMGFGRARP